MANKKGRRRFGNVRKRSSGRYQASYIGPDGVRRFAPATFERKGDADAWLSTVEADILRGDWHDPLAGRVELAGYGDKWISQRKLGPRTRDLYWSLFRLHIVPLIGGRDIGDLSTQVVRSWRAELLSAGRSETTAAKAYRLLRAMMNTAVDDGLIKRNPCRIKGADKEHVPERPVASVAQVFSLADLVPPRFRALVLAAAFTGLRWGELIGLRRCDVDLHVATFRVPRRLAELDDGTFDVGPTKSAAGFRTVHVPSLIMPTVKAHVSEFVQSGDDSLIFIGDRAGRLRRSNFRRAVRWPEIVKTAGLPAGFHFHDLRHTGNNMAASSGASTRELMHRMGHGSMRAALIYQHATSQRDKEIADEMARRAAKELNRSEQAQGNRKRRRRGKS